MRSISGGGLVRKKNHKIRDHARRLRGNMPKAEGLLWWKLRDLNRHGFHFRRQVPIRGYFADFAEHSAKLVVELDGSQHGTDEHHNRDIVRDRVIAAEGYCVLRFWNDDVLRNLDAVVETIMRCAEQRRPPPGALRAPTSPQGGGD
jgi:very-short-patch-repair endonuclease